MSCSSSPKVFQKTRSASEWDLPETVTTSTERTEGTDHARGFLRRYTGCLHGPAVVSAQVNVLAWHGGGDHTAPLHRDFMLCHSANYRRLKGEQPRAGGGREEEGETPPHLQ